ncbi:MAG: SUMF1/EgtB/PvdO family nonheme iron enzyme [Phycisphaerales bacterium]|nr:MAG: SUMF1/EgtB/PvdO family nonheme iron enzyme [Phycisphaerales bacterium]
MKLKTRPLQATTIFRLAVLVTAVVIPSRLSAWQAPTPTRRGPGNVHPSDRFEMAVSDLDMVSFSAMRAAIRDLMTTFPDRYANGREYLRTLDAYQKRLPQIRDALARRQEAVLSEVQQIIAFQRKALLANPLLDFDSLILIKRKPIGDPRRAEEPDRGIGKFIGMPQQSSWQLHTMPNTDGWDNRICILSPVRHEGKLTTLFEPPDGRLVSEMDLHFDARKLMFSMPDARRLWQVYEIGTDGRSMRQVSPDDQPDVHNFDSCYLPNERIAFISTAPFQGVPCNASVNVGMTYIMDADGKNVRQICFEQDHNFCPTVMNDGRILYLRWEYTDIPHVWARFLFTMNPDGTGQREYYGSGGYWPNAIFFARPIPDHPTKVVSIVTGHHVGRVGELVLFDPALGRCATDGVVRRIPQSTEKVEPLIMDKLAMDSWPKFLHPWPLSEKYFIVASKPRPHDLWGIYLVDVFDNMVLVKEVEDYALLEPIPLCPIERPPVIADRVDLDRKDALVYLENIYQGPGLKGVPQGSVKELRLFTYHFAYHKIAGINHRVGADGPWEPKRVLGTVPVEKDGSAIFRVPANTPISIQPLDADGRALQLMRSWMTAMPGEVVSCVGCHEKQNAGAPNLRTIASRSVPSEIKPWRGPVRGFSFSREVQPVLDRHCVSCHDGSTRDDGLKIPDLRREQGSLIAYKNGNPQPRIIEGVPRHELVKQYGGVFEPSYITLRSYVRVGGLESDLRLLAPGEFHADTTELVQMLIKGHHGVKLDAEAWDRIAAWIDLNAPCHGTWSEIVGIEKTTNDCGRRRDLQVLYAGIDINPEVYPQTAQKTIEPIRPEPPPLLKTAVPRVQGWPFDSRRAAQLQAAAGPHRRTIDLGSGVNLDLVLVPAGRFVMGDPDGQPDERPVSPITIEKPFWIGRFEVTNEQYARFDPAHDSRHEHKGSWMFNEWDLGWPLNRPRQPVVRISWQEAVAFCRWLSERSGLNVTLPTEAQWEWACRAGADSPLSYGDLDTDFSQFANMADLTIRGLVYDVRDQYPPDLVPRDRRFNDGMLVTAHVGSYRPNPWGLHDMHGNVWEWTRSRYEPYPYSADDGRNELAGPGKRVVRGGSWYDRPKRCRSAYRLSYPQWRKVYNVGFRIVIEAKDPAPRYAAEK